MAPKERPADPDVMDLIGDYLEHLRQSGRTAETIRGRREILYRLDRDLPFGAGRTTEDELRTWLYQRHLPKNRRRWSKNTIAAYRSTLGDFYGWAVRELAISHDPTQDLPPAQWVKGVARPVTDEQLARILAEAAEPYRTWAVIAAYQGLRCIEISRLDREHVTEQQLVVVRGKGGRPRVHDTDPYVWRAVRDFPPGPIAVWRGRRATAFEVSSNAALHFRRQLKMPGVSLHRLRHWLGVTAQREYRDVRVTQKLLGHASLASTQIYTDATAEQQRAARATLPRLAG